MDTVNIIELPNNFYMGARVDAETHKVQKDMPIYYDARDLLTHGLILGMTGSGKTGLGIALLEEAAIDGIPQIIVDPKGDITNMMLAFPDLTAENFKPWLNPDEAAYSNQSLDEYATTVAERWKRGLGEWGIDNERVQEYRHSGRFSIYTPGSNAGLQLSILKSLAAPQNGFDGNEEILREMISGTVTAILALVGVNATPVEDPEHVLLSNIFEYNWRNQRDLSMEQLIIQVQDPPFAKLGVLDLEEIMSRTKRVKLAKALNNIIASPNFQSWINGEALDVARLLTTEDGYPRTTIIYTAHLNDAERQFILTLLLENVVTWMRSLEGSTSLRALLYIDEVFGLMPPYPLNPPTKAPIMRLLKQARAFGLGVVLATQNPKDIDYKGLSNIGTWFIGKLQTSNDRERVLEGLDGSRDATSNIDMSKIGKLISNLGPREFILHNVHEAETPVLMHTRWAMSYLRGPMTREQISRLMANQRHLVDMSDFQPASLTYSEAATGALPRQTGYAPPTEQPPPGQPATAAKTSLEQSQQMQRPPTGTSERPPTTYTVNPNVAAKANQVDPPPAGFSLTAPELPSSLYQYYLPVDFRLQQAVQQWEISTRQPVMNFDMNKRRILYRPALLAQATVRFNPRQTNSVETRTLAFVVPNLPNVPFLNWNDYMSEPFDPYALEPNPFAEALFADLPDSMNNARSFKDLQGNLTDWLYHNMQIQLYENKQLKLVSEIGETRRDFVIRAQAAARQQRDAEIDAVAARYDKRIASLEDRARKKMMRLQSEQDELGDRKREELISGAESLFQLLRGRAYYTLSRTSRLRRYTSQSEDHVSILESEVSDILDQLDQAEREMEAALKEVQDKWTGIIRATTDLVITPYKKDINLMLFGLGWVPYWDATVNGHAVILPASSSGLSYQQGNGYGSYGGAVPLGGSGYGGQYGQGQGQYDQGQYDQGQYDQGQYDQGQYNQGQYDQGQYDQYQQGGQGYYDEGHIDQGYYGDVDAQGYDYNERGYDPNDGNDYGNSGGSFSGFGGL